MSSFGAAGDVVGLKAMLGNYPRNTKTYFPFLWWSVHTRAKFEGC